MSNYDMYGGISMKIFISWSGESSKNVAEALKIWIPCFFESAEVFFSPEDIEKGQNWSKRLTEELADCNYGIVCLTSENKNAPWINFEAGAIAKAFDSKVTALLVDAKPSDIQGPLSMFQATKLVQDDIYQLIKSINNSMEHPRSEDTLSNLFNALWGKMEENFDHIVAGISATQELEEQPEQNEILESILQTVREQSRFLSNPENILPKNYLSMLLSNSGAYSTDKEDLQRYTRSVLDKIYDMIDSNNIITSKVLLGLKRIVLYTREMIQYQRIDADDLSDRIRVLLRRINRRINIIERQMVDDGEETDSQEDTLQRLFD